MSHQNKTSLRHLLPIFIFHSTKLVKLPVHWTLVASRSAYLNVNCHSERQLKVANATSTFLIIQEFTITAAAAAAAAYNIQYYYVSSAAATTTVAEAAVAADAASSRPIPRYMARTPLLSSTPSFFPETSLGTSFYSCSRASSIHCSELGESCNYISFIT